ncbi:MAG: sugar phosphate nucleotidyltransferase [Bacteroidota bacterium]
MRAIIPVAGVGSRLRPHTYTLPKVLLNVAGKPIIGHIMDKLVEGGFTEATIIIGYLGDKIREYIEANYKLHVDFIEQEERRGLGHAVYSAHETIKNDEPILIILGDTIFDVDLSALVSLQTNAIGVKEVDDPRRFGVAEVIDGVITKVIEKPEKPATNLALVGLYFIRNPQQLMESLKEIIQRGVKTRGEYQLTDGLQRMIEKGEVLVPFLVEGWYDCGKPETLLETNRFLLEKKSLYQPLEGVVIVPPVFISPKSEIVHSVIGPYATIADGAKVHHSIIRNSIVSEDARVVRALLDSSIVGNNAVVNGSYKRINIGDSSEIDFY